MLSANRSRILLGCQWGHEGKGKVVDYLTADAKVVVRFQGGSHAGHSLSVGKGRIALHLIPAAILREGVTGYIGQGVVVSLQTLCEEILALTRLNISVGDNLKISSACPLVLPSHIALDQAREKKHGFQVGSAGRGMSAAVEDKVARRGLRIHDLFNERDLKARLFDLLEYHNFLLQKYYQQDAISTQQTFEELMAAREVVAPFITDVPTALHTLKENNQAMIFEGTDGSLLDVDHGTYPFVSPFNTVSGAAAIGSGLGINFFDSIVGVLSVYCTRVGKGPFPTEQQNAVGESMNKMGGSPIGRRRCGWLDLVALRFAIQVNGLTSLCVTQLDMLDTLEQFDVCTAYRLNGELIDLPPLDPQLLAACEPIYQRFEGWQQKTAGIQQWGDLPSNAQTFLNFIETSVERPIVFISTGPERDAMINREKPSRSNLWSQQTGGNGLYWCRGEDSNLQGVSPTST